MSNIRNIVSRQINQVLVPVFFFALMLSFSSCIEPYTADVEEATDLISVEGSIIRGEPVQTVVVTRTSAMVNPQFLPVRDCRVEVVDDQGAGFLFNENPDGTYTRTIPDEMLKTGRKYQLRVTTPRGERYESSYERLNSGTEVDSVYYRVEDRIDKVAGEELTGLQFYVDLEAADTISRYFRWSLEETYEYTSVAPISYYYLDESLEQYFPEYDTEFFRCWKTAGIKDLFLSSTENLVMNEKKMIPLNYVSTETDRLKIKYSLLIRQYTMSESAYRYWLNNKIATQEAGGLYTQQPGQPVSNIVNVNDSTEQVLGFFWASHKTEQRLTIPRINDLPVFGDPCDLVEFSFADHGKGPFPMYIWVDPMSGIRYTSNRFCFVCTLKGGKTQPPDWWE